MPAARSEATRILGERIRARRTELDLTLETAAPACGMHWSFLGQIERGQRNISFHNLLKIAAGLGVNPAELVDGLRAPGS